MGYESPVETTNLRNAEESVQIAYYGEENHSLGDSCRLVETLKLCISEEVPVRQDENYPLHPVVRLVVGDSDTSRLFRQVARMPTPLAGWGTTLP